MDAFDPQAFHFLRPLALLGLIPAILIALWHAFRHLGRERFASLLSSDLQRVLLTGSERSRRLLVPTAIAAMLGLGAVAVAGPTWQRQDVPARELDDALVVIFDLSLSMYAEDVEPSRLMRARRELADLLRLREEGTTALIAYAGDAHVVTPLTDDVETIRHMSDSLAPEIMPVLGSRTPVAIALANRLLENGAESRGRILAITDGIRGLEASARACDARFPLSILGIGTSAGAPVPVPVGEAGTQVLADAQGNQVIARLDSARLRELARLCGGAYSEVRLGDEDLLAVLPGLLEVSDQLDAREDLQQVDMWVDMAYLLAIPIALALLLAFRRGALPLVLIVLACVPIDVSADFWDDLWRTRDQQALAALQAEDAETASALFESQRWRGVAGFRSGAFADAASSFAGIESKDADDYYNLGNSLAFAGDVPNAIAAYEKALELQQDHEDAAHNKRVLETLLSEQQNQSDQGNQQDSDQDHQPDASQTPSSPGASAEGETPDDSTEPQPQEAEGARSEQQETDSLQQSQAREDDQQDGESSDEQARHSAEAEADAREDQDQNMDATAKASRERERIDSLLRRVPDDPGGLLRQKFLFEAREREQAGEPRVDSEQPW